MKKLLIIFDVVILLLVSILMSGVCNNSEVIVSLQQSLFHAQNTERDELSFNFVANPTEKRVKAGETVTIAFSAENINAGENGINSIVGWLDYDQSVFDSMEFVGISNERNAWNVELNQIEGHKLFGKFCIYTLNEGTTENENIAKMTLKLKDNLKPMVTEIKFTKLASSDGNIEIEEQNRSVKLIIYDEEQVIEDDVPEEEINDEEQKIVEEEKGTVKTGDLTISLAIILISIALIINVCILVKSKKTKIIVSIAIAIVGITLGGIITFANLGDKINDYAVANLKISQWLDSEKYLVTDTDISRIAPKTDISTVEKSLNKNIAIYNNESDFTEEINHISSLEDSETYAGTRISNKDTIIGTGMVAKPDDENALYKISVVGDFDKDGDSNQVELTTIIRNVLNSDKWKLSGIYEKSADMKLDGNIDKQDINASVRYIVYEELEIPGFEKVEPPTFETVEGYYDNELKAFFNNAKIQINQNNDNVNKNVMKLNDGEWTEFESGKNIDFELDGDYEISAFSYGKDGNRSSIVTLPVSKKTPLYSVHYFYDGIEDTSKIETKSEKYGTEISTYEDKVIDGYKLDRAETLPLTVSSKVELNIINVYYVKDEFDYTVKYFYDGVEDTTKAKIVSAEFGKQITTYEDKVIDGYKLEKVEGTPLTITSNASNNVIKVYYIKDNFDYTVKYFYDGVENTEKAETVSAEFGSQITTYEDKVIDGYKLDKTENLPLTISSNASNNVIKVYYVKDNFNYTVKYFYDGVENTEKAETLSAEFGSQITTYEDKVIDGYKFDKTENLPLTISSNASNNVIKVYYVKDNFNYTVKYFYDGVEKTEKAETLSAEFGSQITTYADKVIDGYKLEKVEGTPLTITSNASNNVIKVYYAKDNFNYTVKYFYNGVEKTEKTEILSAEFGSQITTFEDKVIDGYKLEKVEGIPLTITSNASNNVIKVYYVKDNFNYTVKYFYDGVENTEKSETLSAEFGSQITTYTDKVIDGYKFEKIEGTPLTITSNASNNIINVYYVKDNFEYTVHYFYSGIEDGSKVETKSAKFETEITTYEDKVIDGYKLEKVEGTPLTISSNTSSNIINVYYVKDNFGYTVKYFYDEVEDTEKAVTGTAEFGSKITTYSDKVIDGYKLEKVEGTPLTITSNSSNNVIKVYYVKDNFNYTVKYFYDGVENTGKAETLSAEFGSQITTYADKVIDGYKLEKVEGTPLIITSNASNNVIKVYYIKDNFDYTVKYFYDGVENTEKAETLSAEFGSKIENYTDKVIDGYKLNKTENLPLTITSNVDQNIIKVYYIKDGFDYTVKYFYDGEENAEKAETLSAEFGSQITTYADKIIDGYKLDKTENLPLTISSNASNNIIKVYYVKDNFNYTVKYFYDGVENTEKAETLSAEFESQITTYTDKVIDGYKLEKVEGTPLTITSNASNNVIKVYYIKDNFDYIVKYFYDGVENTEKTETLSAEFGSKITTYTDKVIDGYKLEKVEGTPLTITSNKANNIINVYYVKDNFNYIVKYFYDGVENTEKAETLSAEFGSEITTYADKVIDGYKLEKTENLPLTISSNTSNNIINVYYVKDNFGYIVKYFYDGEEDTTKEENGTAEFGSQITTYANKVIDGYKLEKTENLPLTISSNTENNVIKVYYIKDNFGYTVKYFYDGVEDSEKAETLSAEFGSQITTYANKVIDGYKLEKVEGTPLTISSNTSNNIINVYYVKDNFGYTVKYFYDGEEDTTKEENGTAEFGSVISTYEDKVISGYKLSNVEGIDLTISSDASKNIIKVYYIKDAFGYTVEYYYDGILNENKTVRKNAEFNTVVATYTDKIIDGYKFEKIENFPLTVTSTEANNVIKVYYVKDNFGYTVKYFYDEVEDTEKAETGTAEFGSQITTYTNKVIDGYKLDKVENLPLTISSNTANNVINVYYIKDSFAYTVKYFYENVEDTAKAETGTAEFGSQVTEYTDKINDGYEIDTVEGMPLTITSNPENNIIKVYYKLEKFDATVVIHHYINETTNKVAEDEVLTAKDLTILTQPTTTYETTHLSSTTNKLKINNEEQSEERSYIDSEKYSFVSVSIDEEGQTADENGIVTGRFTKESQEVTYYYSPYMYTITGEVIGENGEFKHDITEQVVHGEDSTKDIVIIPEYGYSIDKLMLYTDDEIDGTYLTEDDGGTEITSYKENKRSGTYTLNKFEDVRHDMHIVVTFKEREYVAQIVTVPEGSEEYTNESGKTILGNKYYTLEEAIEDAAIANENDGIVEIKILTDIDGEIVSIEDGNNVAIDLNEHTITADSGENTEGVFTVGNAELVVVDKSEIKSGKIINTNPDGIGIYITLNGECTLGADDGKVSVISPSVEAGKIGVFKEINYNAEQIFDEETGDTYYPQGIFNFYDGKITAETAISGRTNQTPILYNATITVDDNKQVSVLAIVSSVEARVGRKTYMFIEDAIEEANTVIGRDGSQVEIVVVADISKSQPIIIDSTKNIKIDLNGHTVTNNVDDYIIKNYGSLELCDSSVDEDNPYGAGKILSTTANAIYNGNNGSTVIQEYNLNDVVQGNPYGYEINENGEIVFSNNTNQTITATGAICIDLTDREGIYRVSVVEEHKYKSTLYAFATIKANETNDIRHSDSDGRFMYVNQNKPDTKYTSDGLVGGKKYYLYIGCYMSKTADQSAIFKQITLEKMAGAELKVDTCTIGLEGRSAQRYAIENEGNLIVGDSESTEMPRLYSSITNSINAALIFNSANATINNAKLDQNGTTAIRNRAYTVINNAQIDTNSGNGCMINNNNNILRGAKLIINDGFYNVPITNNTEGNIIINGGTYNQKINVADWCKNSNTTINGGIFNGAVEGYCSGTTVITLTINNGEFNGKININTNINTTINDGIFNEVVTNNGGALTINEGTFNNQIINKAATNIDINKATIETSEKAINPIRNESTGTINIRDGSINACYPVYNKTTGTIVLGKDDETISTTSPIITSTANAISNASGTFKFYDGKIIAPNESTIIGLVSDIPDETEIIVDKIDGNDVAYINAIGTPVAKIGTTTYTSLKSAIEAVPEGTSEKTEIVLLKTVYICETLEIPETKNIKLDLNNCRIYDLVDGELINNNGIFEIYTNSVSENHNINLASRINNGGYGFDIIDGKLVSNNVGVKNSLATCYMEIDLSDKQGEYELILNTDISSYYTNKGYVVITEDTETPTYSNATDKILDTSGTYSNVETRATLIGGKIYYVHFGYTKTNQNSNADTFTINSVRLENHESKIINKSVKNIFTNNNELTIKDAYIVFNASDDSKNCYNVIENTGNVVLDGTTFQEYTTKEYEYCGIVNNTEEGSVQIKDSRIIMKNCSGNYIAKNAGTGNVTIDGGYYDTNIIVDNKSTGSVTIESGTIMARNDGVLNESTGTVTINDGDFINEKAVHLKDGKAIVNGGRYNGSSNIPFNIEKGELIINDAYVTISGGYTAVSNKGKTTINNATFMDSCVIVNDGEFIINNMYLEGKIRNGQFSKDATMIINDATICKSAEAITNSVYLTIYKCDIKATTTGINTSKSLTLGSKDNIVDLESISIYGETTGITAGSSEFNFYDGVVEGKTAKSINGSIGDTEEGYEIIKESISTTREKAYPSKTAMARIVSTGEQYYSLNDAFAACRDNEEETIEILRETVISSTIPSAIVGSNKKITLDLAGNLISSANENTIDVEGELTIKDSSENVSGRLKNTANKLIKVENDGILNIENTKLETTTINNTISTQGTVNIYGGTFYSNSNSENVIIQVDAGNVYIYGGKFENTSAKAINIENDSSEVIIYDVQIPSSSSIDNNSNSEKVKILGGMIGVIYNNMAGKIEIGSTQEDSSIPNLRKIENNSTGTIIVNNVNMSTQSESYSRVENTAGGLILFKNGLVRNQMDVALIKNNCGTLTIEDGTFYITVADGIYCGDKGNSVVNIYGGSIQSTRGTGIKGNLKSNCTNEINIYGGTILANSKEAIDTVGALTLGVDDGVIDNESIHITSDAKNAITANGTFNYYEGTIQGKMQTNEYEAIDATIYGRITDMPSGTNITYEKGEFEIARLESNNVAKVGTNYYNTLEEAFAACTSGIENQDKIELLKDVGIGGESIQINNNQNIVLDLCGYRLNVYSKFINSGVFVIDDSSEEASGIVDVSKELVENNGKFELRNGYVYSYMFDRTTNGARAKLIENNENGQITISGGKVFHRASAGEYAYTIYNKSAKSVNFEGGIMNIYAEYGGYADGISSSLVLYNQYAGEEDLNINLHGTEFYSIGYKNGVYIINNPISNVGMNIDITGGIIGENCDYAIYTSNNSVKSFNMSGGTINSPCTLNAMNDSEFTLTGGTLGKITINKFDNIKMLGGTLNNETTVYNYGKTEGIFEYNGATSTNILKIQSINNVKIKSGLLKDIEFSNAKGTIENVTISGNVKETGSSSISMLSGTIDNPNGYGLTLSQGTFILGNAEYPVYQSAPSIKGSTYGVSIASGAIFKFYDGVIIGTENGAISGIVNETPELYQVILSEEGKVANLGIIATFEQICTMDGAYFDSLQTAINAAGANAKTIVMAKNVTLENAINIGSNQNITIDLCGCSIRTAIADSYVFNNNGTLNIIDTSDTAQAEVEDNYIAGEIQNLAGIAIKNNGTLNIGVNDGVEMTKSPHIKGTPIAIDNAGTYNKYDGKVEDLAD